MSNDLEIIRQLEDEYYIKLVPLKEISRGTLKRGYVLDADGNVIGLQLPSLRPRDWYFLKNFSNLTSLDLSYNKISDSTFLKNLPSLTSLYLIENDISDGATLKDLPSLTHLDLSANKISDGTFLTSLSNLTNLDLSSNAISDWSFLKNLSNLTCLDLRNNHISDGKFLKNLPKITSLDLSHNNISEVAFFKNIPSLTSLDLKNSNISDGSFLKDFSNLTYLDLENNNISDGSFLKNFSNLTSLYLRNNNISDGSFLSNLFNLKSLNLSNNNISKGEFFKNLTNLTSLNLGDNKISEAFLKNLTNLTSLHLDSTNIFDWSFLSNLSKLTSLGLSNNNISDGSFLKNLSNLRSLYFGNNKISDWSFLSNLSNLETLFLNSNKISDASFLEKLSNLTYLYLNSNKVSDLSFLKRLTNLTQLYLRYNKISDATFFKDMKTLIILELSENQIKHLPREFFNLRLWQPWSEVLNRNPMESPPMEIILRGDRDIQAYFESLVGPQTPSTELERVEKVIRPRMVGKKEIGEVKVLLVGEGGAGKTSLVKQLLGKGFDKKEPKTDGINIEHWLIGKKEIGEEREIKARLWDFGGQVIMQATHQFFLSKRSLYILVLDGRKEEDAEHWLKLIESFGGDSPILIVLNKIDQNPGFDLNRKHLQEKYPSIKGFHRLSCQSKDGMNAFQQALCRELALVPHLQTTWAESWFKVKTTLESMTEDYISYERFEELCRNAGIKQETQRATLVAFLNDLGVVVHFDEPALRETNIINPRWLTEAVYKIINSKPLADNRGLLAKATLCEMLSAERYPARQHDYILELMKKFELCYALGQRQVLIPNLLEVKEPEFDFAFDHRNSLKFRFEYDFLPKSVMPNFIVRMHGDIFGDYQWRTGVVLKDQKLDAIAIVKSDARDKRIYIEVDGAQKRDYFAVIRREIRDINGRFQKLAVKEMVPLPDYPKETVDYEELIGHERKGWDEYRSGILGKAYSVSELLDGIERKEERLRERFHREGDRFEIHAENVNLSKGDYSKQRLSVKSETPVVPANGKKISLWKKFKKEITFVSAAVGIVASFYAIREGCGTKSSEQAAKAKQPAVVVDSLAVQNPDSSAIKKVAK